MNSELWDVVIYGGTPGGIGAALAAARRKRKTLLVEPSPYIGGLMTSGLGRTDIVSLEASGSVFREYADRVLQNYTECYGTDSEQVRACNRGLFFEPSVAKRTLWEMIEAESELLRVERHTVLSDVRLEGARLRSIAVVGRSGGNKRWLEAGAFIDATYEGDLAALAGVPYTIGREGRDVWNEEYAGMLYMDFANKEVFPGSTGKGDNRVQAYNFRLCLTQAPGRVLFPKPDDYNRERYESLLADVSGGRVKSIRNVMNILPVPNGKTDTNNHHCCMCSTDYPEENTDYPEASFTERESIVERHRNSVLGLLWFLQNDEDLPASFREEALNWGFSADEFADSNNFPPQIYVREARRIEGEYRFTENDARLAPGLGRAPIHYDSIGIGDYPIDSHATRKREPQGQNRALEGFLGLGWLTKVYQIPFGVMVPQQVDGLLVPVAVSASHMGFGTIRMEPCWMQLGFAAGVAADLQIAKNVDFRQLPIEKLQEELLQAGQRITFFEDVDWEDPARKAAEFFGTRGFFSDYQACLKEGLYVAEASHWIAQMRSWPNGRRLPVLPASDGLLSEGTDMGPRLPKTELSPEAYWAAYPKLSIRTAQRWFSAAARSLGTGAVEPLPDDNRPITRGEFCVRLYKLLKPSI